TTEECGKETVRVVKARIRVNPHTATNIVGNDHVVTATVDTITDTIYTPVLGATVTFTILTDTTGAAVFKPGLANTCVTNASGQCTVTITDANAGVVTLHALATGFGQKNVVGTFTVFT